MKKSVKRFLALGLILGVICSIGSVSFAATHREKKINGSWARCKSDISNGTASAWTNYDGSGSVYVSSKYYCRHIGTGNVKCTQRSKLNYGTAEVKFKADSGCLSRDISSEHKVSVPGESWKVNTSNVFP